ncbi:MAG TPA: hypothetical protein VKZ53_06350 [Candidatus Angelobacter sp.]|nr:hypothetical protein [Candidatus Angelobacter sp.]
MGRVLSLIAVLLVMAAGAYVYMKQAQGVTPTGATAPNAAVDLVGVKNDLLAIANAERHHGTQFGKYVSIEELRAAGDLVMARSNRGPYDYTADTADNTFRIVATYSGPDLAMPKTITVDESMEVMEH